MSSNVMLILSFSIVLNSVGRFHSLQGQNQGFGFRFRFLCLNHVHFHLLESTQESDYGTIWN